MFHVPNQFRYKMIFRGRPSTLTNTEADGNNGFFVFDYKGYEVRCQASDGLGWEHVSVTIDRPRTPTWEIMNYVKDLFWDEDDAVVQIHPPKDQYVNCHPYCLHLWRPIGVTIPLPVPAMVGPIFKL